MTSGGGCGTGEQFDKDVNAADTWMVDVPSLGAKWANMNKVVKVLLLYRKLSQKDFGILLAEMRRRGGGVEG